MLNFEVSAPTRELLARINDWSISEVRPLAREADNLGPPERAKEVIEKCPVGNCPLDFVMIGPAVRGREDDIEYTRSLEGGGAYLGLLCMEEMNVGDGWGWQSLPGNNLGERAVRLLGNSDQVHRWADGILRGEYSVTSICMTEDHCGLDLSQIKTTAVQSEGGWILNGEKRFISHGAYADYLVVFAQTQVGSGLRGIRAFIVEPGDEGFEVVKYSEDKFGTRYYPASTLRFNNVWLPEERMLENTNFGEFMNILNGSRPFCVAIGLGSARGMLEYAVNWRNSNNRPVSQRFRQQFQDQVDQMRGGLDSVRRMILRAGRIHDSGVPDPVIAHKAKAFALPILERVAFRSMQLMGPEAWSKAHLMEKWYRDAKTNDIIEGTGNMHRIYIARSEYGSAAAN